jgi:hypothetical protein
VPWLLRDEPEDDQAKIAVREKSAQLQVRGIGPAAATPATACMSGVIGFISGKASAAFVV